MFRFIFERPSCHSFLLVARGEKFLTSGGLSDWGMSDFPQLKIREGYISSWSTYLSKAFLSPCSVGGRMK